jgi:hypothetical protein
MLRLLWLSAPWRNSGLGYDVATYKNTNVEESYRFRLHHPWSILDLLPHRGDVILEGYVRFYTQTSPVPVIQNDSCEGGTHGQDEDSGLYWLDVTLTVRPVTKVPPVPPFPVWSQNRRLILETVLDERNRDPW